METSCYAFRITGSWWGARINHRWIPWKRTSHTEPGYLHLLLTWTNYSINRRLSRPLLLTWINFNPSVDKQLHPLLSVGWNYISIPTKLQWLHCQSVGMDKLFHPTLYLTCDYLSMPGIKVNPCSWKEPLVIWWFHASCDVAVIINLKLSMPVDNITLCQGIPLCSDGLHQHRILQPWTRWPTRHA